MEPTSSLAQRVIEKSLVRFDVGEFIEDLVPFTPKDLAELFVLSAIQKSAWQFEGAHRAELSTLAHLSQTLVSYMEIEDEGTFREFLRHTIKMMDEKVREFAAKGFASVDVLYRSFDELDEILGIEYGLDHGMTSDPAQKERLYEGAGAGVQTSYSSILQALDRANIKPNGKVFDLGSGYGRVGFVLGLLRPDIEFTGYEYVPHRVSDSTSVASHAGLEQVEFIAQDLSLEAFRLPLADVYYMYDPFSRETYAHVLNQLVEYGRQHKVKIITKGRANTWVADALRTHGWSLDDSIDGGTVHLFVSP